MGISVLQPSFAAGELSPTLFSRVDLARYQIGLKTCKNFQVMQHGGVRNRAGTRYVDSTPNNAQVRLVRFKFSINDACMLVFGNFVMYVVRNGAYIQASGGGAYNIATPWSIADLSELNWTQSADVMTFVHSAYRPRELKRFANDNWTITEPTYLPTVPTPTGVQVSTPAGGTGAAKIVKVQVTAVIDDTLLIQESLPATSAAITIYNSDPTLSVGWNGVPGATYYNIYKDDTGSGVYGFVGRAVTNAFVDRNIVATKTDTPPTGADPFVGTGNYPSAVGYYQQRKVYGGSLLNPQTSYFSRTGDFNNFGYSSPGKDDDSITWTMASTEVNRILNYLPIKDSLMTFTSGAEWAIAGQSSGFTAKTINGNPQSYNGSGFVPPLVLNDTAVYLQSRGQAVAGLNYSLEADGIASEDLTIWSTHLFRDYSITSWCYQRLPDSIIWAVRSDGTMLGLTYLRRQDIIAWHRHETDGDIESICCIPEGQEDVVYMVVKRLINGVTKRFIERMQTRNIPTMYDTGKRDAGMGFFVDAGLSYYGWNDTSITAGLYNSATWLYPDVVEIQSSVNFFAASDVGKQFAFRDPATLSVTYVDVTEYISPILMRGVPTAKIPEGLRNVATPMFARCIKTVTGLSHLEGKQVAILADGLVIADNVTGNYTVTGGTIVLPSPAGLVHIGLPYTSDVETLRINVSGQETLNDKLKTVSSVTVIVDESRGIFAGKDQNSLWEAKQRFDENYNDPVDLLTGTTKIQITNDFDGQGQVFIRQSDPLPLTILGIIPELTIAGKA